MKAPAHCVLLIGCTALLPAVWGQSSAHPEGPAADWNVGDSWTVRTWYALVTHFAQKDAKDIFIPKGNEVLVSMSVTGMEEIDGHPCYEIRAVYPKDQTGFQKRYLLYFRADTVKLVRVVDKSLKSDGAAKQSVTRYPMEATGPTIADSGAPNSFVYDFPALSSSDLSSTGADGKIRRQARCEGVKQDAIGRRYVEKEFVLTLSKEDRELRKVAFTWVEGDPWWRRAVYWKEGKIVNEAELVEFTTEGIRRVVKPRQDEE